MSSRLDVTATALSGVSVIVRKPVADDRGWLERMFCTTDLAGILGSRTVVQVNRTLTRAAATVRGMHYQLPPSAEAKLVSCLHGRIFDVAVDLRRGSPTFLRWHGEVLSEENHRSLFIPEGFAHGYQTLVEDCELLYVHTAPYDPAAERGVNPLDARVAIAWPLAVGDISERDAARPPLDPGFGGLVA